MRGRVRWMCVKPSSRHIRRSYVATYMIIHEVGLNWRQRHDTVERKVEAFLSGFGHARPLEFKQVRRDDFLALRKLESLPSGLVWSMISWVLCSNDRDREVNMRHIPMMNFHPEGIGLTEIKLALGVLCPSWGGAILDSGRHQHYYGNHLLDGGEWVKWMAEFLGPCILVSPRYIGHRLHHGYCSLRLTSDPEYKPKIPRVIAIV